MVDQGLYTGGSLVWKFQNDSDLAAYEPCRKAYHTARQGSGCASAVIVVLILSPLSTVGIFASGLVLLVLLTLSAMPYLQRGYFEGRYGLSESQLTLNPHRLIIVEKFGDKSVLLGSVRGKAVRTAQWLNDGCWIEVGVVHLQAAHAELLQARVRQAFVEQGGSVLGDSHAMVGSLRPRRPGFRAAGGRPPRAGTRLRRRTAASAPATLS